MLVRKQKRAAVLFLAASLVLGGCAGSGGAEGDGDRLAQPGKIAGELIGGGASGEGTGMSLIGEDGSWLGTGGCYKAGTTELKETVQGACAYGEDVYKYSIDISQENYSMYVSRGEEIFYQSEGILGMTCVEDGIWILDDTTDYAVSDTRSYALVKTGYDKQELVKKDITKYMDGYFVRGMRTDESGRLFMLMEESVAVFSENGDFQSSIDLGASGKRLALGSDGRVYAAVGQGGAGGSSLASTSETGSGSDVICLDADTQSGESVGEYDGYQLCDGGEGYLFTLVSDDGLYGVPSRGGELETIALWAELGLAFQNVKTVQFMSGGKFLLEDSNAIVVMEPAEPSEVKPKILLTMAAVSRYSPFTSLVAAFNLSNDKYMVKINDYTNKEELSTKDAIDKLNLDIMSGNYPDLFDFLMLPGAYYSDKGLLDDLYTYMDKDTDVNKEDFIGLDKLESDGALYYVAGRFNLETAAGLYSRFEDSYGWSLKDYLEIQSQYSGEVMYNITRENFLKNMVYRYAADAVDWKNGTSSFDSQEFIDLLKAVAQIRENPEPENSADLDFTPGGRRLREGTLIADVHYISTVTDLVQAEKEAGEKLSFIGWPTTDGAGGTRFSPDNSIGICSKGNQEGAWEFVKYVLIEGAKQPEFYGLSMNRNTLKAQVAEAQAAYEKGESELPMEEGDVQRLYDLIDRSVYYGNASNKVVDIVMEEAAAFLAGAKTAEETAKVIQSRVGILVAE